MSTLDVVAQILREVAPRALKARQIAALAGGRLPTASKTPETVISRDLAIDVRDRGTSSRFLRVDRGAFVLKEALPTALYNELESYPAAWTRNLIAAGEIAAGVVDERSIRDLKPADVASYRQFHAFSGIGVWSRALRDAGIPDDFNVWSGSAPCQPWSSAGKRGGETDERHLWPEWFRLIRACGPAVIVGEQVASKDGYRWLDEVAGDFESVGYNFTATELSAAVVGAPHRRQRIYFVAYLGQRLSAIRRILPVPARGSVEAPLTGTGLFALHAHVENEADSTGSPRDRSFLVEAEGDLTVGVADTCERGREILGASWLHDRGQPGHDAARRGEAHGRDSCAVSDTTVARPRVSQDIGTDRGDAGTGAEAGHRGSTGGLEPERGGDADEAGTVSDAERVVWDAGRAPGPLGRSEVKPDRHGEAHGTGCSCVGSVGLGDAGRARGGRDTGAVPRAQEAGEGERIEAGDLADKPGAPGADDGGIKHSIDGLVRGAANVAGDGGAGSRAVGFRPGDRIRLDGDPAWSGAVGGYWSVDVEWIYCRPEPGHEDGRWRPIESGTFALVDGPAPGVGRTRAKRLKGFGNAIVLPQATAFVTAVIDSFVEATRGQVTPVEVAEVVAETAAEKPFTPVPTIVVETAEDRSA